MFMTRTIFSNLVHKYSTRLHPFVKRPPLPGTRAKLVFTADTCILCSICEKKCPSQVITVEPEKGLWQLDVMGCVSCGVCADVCPTDSITMSEEYRAPLTERTTQTYYCKPRKKKEKAAKAEAAGDRTAPEADEPADSGPEKDEETAPVQGGGATPAKAKIAAVPAITLAAGVPAKAVAAEVPVKTTAGEVSARVEGRLVAKDSKSAVTLKKGKKGRK